MSDIALLVAVGIVVVAVIAVLLLFRLSWRIAEPDEALIISGFRAGPADPTGGDGASGSSRGAARSSSRG